MLSIDCGEEQVTFRSSVSGGSCRSLALTPGRLASGQVCFAGQRSSAKLTKRVRKLVSIERPRRRKGASIEVTRPNLDITKGSVPVEHQSPLLLSLSLEPIVL